jgi:hypothetical protein
MALWVAIFKHVPTWPLNLLKTSRNVYKEDRPVSPQAEIATDEDETRPSVHFKLSLTARHVVQV